MITYRLTPIIVCLSIVLFFFYVLKSSTQIAHHGGPASAPKPLPTQPPPQSQTSLFSPGQAKSASSNYSRILVMGRRKDDDISWIARDLPGLKTAIYVVDDNSGPLRIPQNKGHEAMVYLTYIIDNYDELPDTSLFFHPHQITWHNNILLNLDTAFTIDSLSDARVAREGYFNARCHHDPGCPNWLHLDRPEEEWDLVKKTEERHFTSKLWRELHPGAPLPASISQPCCAQFAVSKDRIRQRPRSEYIRYRDWLLNTELADEISGRIMEYTWQYIFAGTSEFCPPVHECYCDGYGVCFGGAEQLQAWLDLLKKREIADAEAKVLMEAGQSEDSESVKFLKEQSANFNKELSARKEAAYRRGDSPKNRASEAGRNWNEGDGF